MSEDKYNPVLHNVVVTDSDMKALVRIRNHFGEHDKTMLEHLAYDVLDRIIGKYVINDIATTK